MNLMFRKNFREGCSKAGIGGGSKLQSKASRTKRSRDTSLIQTEDIHYRTHLFFSPNRPGYDVGEEKCSAFTGACTQLSTTAATNLPLQSLDLDAPQPLVDRKPSVSLLRWNHSNNYNNNNHSNSVRARNETNAGTPLAGIMTMSLYSDCYNNSNNNNNSIYNNNNNNYNYNNPSYNYNNSNFTNNNNNNNYNYSDNKNNNNNNNNCNYINISGATTTSLARSEPISLATLDRDCFIIPVHSVDRFLPAGIPLPAPSQPSVDGSTKAASTHPLSVLEVADPKLCILVHLMSPLEAIDPVLESPLAHPLLKQRALASELVTEAQQTNTAVGGMLLANMERNSEFPFVAYYLINTMTTDPTHFYSNIRVSSLSKFEPKSLRYTAAHTLDLYSEVAAICRPPLVMPTNEVGSFKKTQTPSTGYIISVFKVFEGDDGERFEKNWLYWTGARMLYRYLPRAAGLRRIALHKSTSQKGDKMYLLVCECADLLKDISSAAFLIPALRARLCGYTGLYRPIQIF